MALHTIRLIPNRGPSLPGHTTNVGRPPAPRRRAQNAYTTYRLWTFAGHTTKIMLAVVTNAALLGAFESALLSSSGNVTALDALNLYLICQTQHPQQFCLTPRGQLIDRICHATFRKMQFVKSGSFHVSRDGTVVVITSGPPYVHTTHDISDLDEQVVDGCKRSRLLTILSSARYLAVRS